MFEPNNQLTGPEEKILWFLKANKGIEYTAEQIQHKTGIHAELIAPIMHNLRYKGYEVCSHKGKHYFPKDGILGYLILGFMFYCLILVFLNGLFDITITWK